MEQFLSSKTLHSIPPKLSVCSFSRQLVETNSATPLAILVARPRLIIIYVNRATLFTIALACTSEKYYSMGVQKYHACVNINEDLFPCDQRSIIQKCSHKVVFNFFDTSTEDCVGLVHQFCQLQNQTHIKKFTRKYILLKLFII